MSKEVRKVEKAIDLCDYLLEIIEDLDRFDVSKDSIQNPIESLKKELEVKKIELVKKETTEFDALIIPGKILSISGGDGISYSQTDYYAIQEVNRKKNEVTADVITVVFGEYGNSVALDRKRRVELDTLIRQLRTSYHETEKDLSKEWEIYTKYCNEIPEIK